MRHLLNSSWTLQQLGNSISTLVTNGPKLNKLHSVRPNLTRHNIHVSFQSIHWYWKTFHLNSHITGLSPQTLQFMTVLLIKNMDTLVKQTPRVSLCLSLRSARGGGGVLPYNFMGYIGTAVKGMVFKQFTLG